MKFTDWTTKHEGAIPGLVSRSRAIVCALLLSVALWGQSGTWVSGSSGSIYYNGDVGIGTSSPQGLLDVNGNTQFRWRTDLGTASYMYLDVQGDNSPGSVKLQTYGGGNVSTGAVNGYPSNFPLVLQPVAGFVGIGTTNPTDKLEAFGGNGSYVKSTAPQSGTNDWAGFQIKSWIASAPDTWSLQGGSLTGGNSSTFAIANNESARFLIDSNGNVGIGVGYNSPRPYTLSVNGTIGAQQVIVTSAGWADYVFEPGYHLTPLDEVSAYIRQNHHLPDIPSQAEVKDKGISLGDMQAKLLAKVEELTLHMIEAEKRGKQLERENRDLLERVRRVEAVQQPAIGEDPGKTGEIR